MATANNSSESHPIILEGRAIETAPALAPKPRFKVNDAAILRITVRDGLMTRSSAGFNPGTCYVDVLFVPSGSPPAPIGASSFCPGVVKAVSWDSSQDKYFVLLSLQGIVSSNKWYWVAEDQGGLLKPMYEVGDKVSVRTAEPIFDAIGQQYLFATVLQREATLDLCYDIGYRLNIGNVWCEGLNIGNVWCEELKVVRGIDGAHMESDEKYAARLKASGRDTADLGPPTIPQLASYWF